MNHKINSVDYHWFIIRTLPHQEKKLQDLLLLHQPKMKNILEVYCPTHTTVKKVSNGKEIDAPLFAGEVFVLATHHVLVEFVSKYYPKGIVMYDRHTGDKPQVWTIPEPQMRFFMDFNNNYAEHVVVLERPYSDYAFNPKTNEPNEVIKVLDGPLAGRTGYLTRFRKNRRLVFNMEGFDSNSHITVAIPDIWNFHVVRLHNADCDRQTIATKKARAVDLLEDILQGLGYGEETITMLHDMVRLLSVKPSLISLCQTLYHNHKALSQAITRFTSEEAELIMYLIRYEQENPGYVQSTWQQLILRPFLTPTSVIVGENEKDHAVLQHPDFTEIICRKTITEQTYYPKSGKEIQLSTPYYAHIGIIKDEDKGYTLFANWDTFLGEYFMTAGNANKKLLNATMQPSAENTSVDSRLDSFINYAPTLYQILTNKASVKAIQAFRIGDRNINVLAIHVNDVTISEDTPFMENPEIAKAADDLISIGIKVCQEISTTTHLAVWRRYLRSVWLHR